MRCFKNNRGARGEYYLIIFMVGFVFESCDNCVRNQDNKSYKEYDDISNGMNKIPQYQMNKESKVVTFCSV